MARVRVVELLDARGHVKTRVRIDAFPATVGRAYDSDLILDDPFVSPHHLRLLEDERGALWVEDAGSTNGTRLVGRGTPERRFQLPSGGAVIAGRTTLRVFDADHVVPEAVADHRRFSPASVFHTPRNVAWAAGAVALLYAFEGYLTSTSRDVAERVVTMSLGVLILVAIWAGLWALVGRISHAGAKYLTHLGWGAAGTLVLTALSTLLVWVEFAIPSSEVVTSLTSLVLAAALAIFITGHVTIASSLTPRQALRRTAIASVAAALAVAVVSLTSRDQFTPTPEYPTGLASLPTVLLSTEDAGSFAAEALTLQKEVDELARKRERASLLSGALKVP